MSFRIARKTSLKSTFGQHRLGAVIEKGGRVLSTGYNEMRFSKEIGEPSLHAEEAAIIKLIKERRLHDLVGSTLYVSRFTRGGAIGLAKPCSRCMSLIKSVGIKDICYTTDDGTKEERV